MSVQLLDKTRKINKLLHNNNSSKVVFNDICQVLTEILDSNILVISRKGKVLGVSLCPGVEEIKELIDDEVGGYIDSMLNERLLGVLSTKENVNLETLGFVGDNIKKYQAIINPIDIAGERLGTVFMYKSDSQYEIDDIILSEYGTTVVGLEMMRSVHEENAEENRKIQIVKSAINTLSFSELEAIIHIFDELDGMEGILVASKIADRVGIPFRYRQRPSKIRECRRHRVPLQRNERHLHQGFERCGFRRTGRNQETEEIKHTKEALHQKKLVRCFFSVKNKNI